MNENQLQTLLNAINTLQDLGKVAYFNKGNFNSQTEYEINDVVSYNGSSYVSLVNNNRGNLPTNTAFWSVVASKGDKGDTGKAFVIEKTYPSIEDMVDDYDNMAINDYVMIQGDIEEQENATLWVKTDTEVSPYKWVYLADFSGASGITGATPNIQIGTVTEGNQPSVTRRAGSTNENPILDFVLKTGAKGDTGATGNGISSVSKTGTSGLTDIYTIAYTNGGSDTFNVVNGKGIVSIEKTGSVDTVDTYTITYNDGTTSTFEVTNGEVTQAQLDETNGEVERANMVYNALPKVSSEGTSLSLNNTAECPVYDVGLGPSELQQKTTTGKNALNALDYISTTASATFTNDIIRVYSTRVNTSPFIQYVYSVQENDVVRLNGIIQSSQGRFVLQTSTDGTNYSTVSTATRNYIDGTTISSFEYTIPAGVIYIRVILYSDKGVTTGDSESYYKNVIITINNSDMTYEPFTNGPSPNADFPQQIHIISGNNNIKIENGNLFSSEWEQGNINSTTGINEPNINSIRTKDYISVIPNQHYAINRNLSEGSMNVRCYDKNKTYLGAGGDYITLISGTSAGNPMGSHVSECVIAPKDNVYYIRFTDLTNDLSTKYMMTKGDAQVNYRPYTSQPYSLTLDTIEYDKIGDYEDVFFKNVVGNPNYNNSLQVGKWYLKKNIGKTTDTIGSTSKTISDMVSDATVYSYCGGTVSGTTITYSKALIVANYIYYPTTTPTYTLLSNTLQTQLDNLLKAISYQEQTNVSQTNADLPFVIKMSAIRDMSGIFELITE